MEIYGHEPLGFHGFLVNIEADIRPGIPAIEIVGLASTAVREARERVRIALRNSGFEFPLDRILINLSPADLPKEGSAYDLPIAIKLLNRSAQVMDIDEPVLAMGELMLNGEVRRVRGVLPATRAAREAGIAHCIVPVENAAEANQVRSMKVWSIRNLAELPHILSQINDHKEPIIPNSECSVSESMVLNSDQSTACLDFSDWKGGADLLRALIIAAAGRHNLLLAGPPGGGKTMAAMRFPSLLPDLDEQSALETASLYSLWGSGAFHSLPKRPPFRSPHHSASLEGLMGGSKPIRPGEVSLAHNGILFLDECAEFRRDVLQSLREPAEWGYVNIVRAGRTVRFPSDFQLIMATNPCPCGNLGSKHGTCVCSAEEIRKYWKRIGGPLLDRIDMRLSVAPPSPAELLEGKKVDTNAIRNKIHQAWELQKERNSRAFDEDRIASGMDKRVLNSRIPPASIQKCCKLTGNASKLFEAGMNAFGLSARAAHSVLKIARTIADLDNKDFISESAIEEALSYRQLGEGDAVWAT